MGGLSEVVIVPKEGFVRTAKNLSAGGVVSEMTNRRLVMPPPPFRLHRAVQPPPAPPRDLATDCRYYRGLEHCGYAPSCSGCVQYQPYQHRICLIHVHDLAKVVQSLPLLLELRRQFPEAQVTWVSSVGGYELLVGHPLVDRVVVFEPMTALVLGQQSFDLVVNLDAAPEACALMMALFARHKLGLGLGPAGQVIPLNAHARLWFANARGTEKDSSGEAGRGERSAASSHGERGAGKSVSYACWIHHGLGLTWRGERCAPVVQQSQRDRIRRFLLQTGWQPALKSLLVAADGWGEVGSLEEVAELVSGMLESIGGTGRPMQVILAGQPEERGLVERILERCRGEGGLRVLDAGTEHPLGAVPALVEAVDAVVGPDGLMSSLGAALGKPVVVVLGPREGPVPELFGRGSLVEVGTRSGALEPAGGMKETAAMLVEAVRRALEEEQEEESLRQAG